MDFNTYMPLAMRTAKKMPTKLDDLKHAAIGLVTEIGEFATEVKRHSIYGRPLTPEMREHMIEELFDSQWYAALMLTTLGKTYVEPDDKVREEIARMALGNLLDSTLLAASMMLGSVAFLFRDPEKDDVDDVDAVHGMVCMLIYILDQISMQLVIASDEGRRRNIAKLRLRYPDAYSDLAAEARADKGGLPASAS